MLSNFFHTMGLLGLMPMLMLAFLGNAFGAIFCAALIITLHILGAVSDETA